jgi:excisionase family DNA binding protein
MKQLYDVISAARLLSISPWTVRSYIHNGKLRPVRLGRRVLLEEAELERFVADGKNQNHVAPVEHNGRPARPEIGDLL